MSDSPEFVAARDKYMTGPTPPRGLLPLDVKGGARCGVYFLIQHKPPLNPASTRKLPIVVYIGSSINVLGRVGEHAKSKQFDDARWLPTSAGERLDIERQWIERLRPKLNGYVDNRGVKQWCLPRMPWATLQQESA